MDVLDLFSAAAGGWSLGMHRAGFRTIAACEAVDWRRILYAQNNPGVLIYDDVRTLTADRLLHDLGRLPPIIVGSPPCQDISPANTKGKGVEGERSGLFFEAVRIIGECRPRWFALENSANLRTRGADAVLAALEDLGYACWPLVVRASDIGANHERPRCWLIGCDVAQVAHPDGYGEHAQPEHGKVAELPGLGGDRGRGNATDPDKDEIRQPELSRGTEPEAAFAGHASRDPAQDGRGQGLPRRCSEPASRPQFEACGDAARNTPDPAEVGSEGQTRPQQPGQGEVAEYAAGDRGRDAAYAEEIGFRTDGEASRPRNMGQAERPPSDRAYGSRRGWIDGPGQPQMAIRQADRGDTATGWPLWSLDDLAGRLWLDDGLPARLAGTRVAVGGPRGTAAASLIVEAYGDAVVPQIPEAIGRAILRVEEAMRAVSIARSAVPGRATP